MGTMSLAMTKRRLIVRDALAFLALLAITVALFAVTLFLFQRFQAHRAMLARRWASRGAAAFDARRPREAEVAYRTALNYAPGDPAYEMRLAEALGAAGQREEAYSYFLGLWEARPGDGFLNLQLARLAAERRDVQAAVEFYRASIYGTWEGDGLMRRREARLELVRFLIAQRRPEAARAELLVAGGDAPNSPEVYMQLAGLLEEAGAAGDALRYDRKALAVDPRNRSALDAAARLAFAAGDFAGVRDLLEAAQRRGMPQAENAALLDQANTALKPASRQRGKAVRDR